MQRIPEAGAEQLSLKLPRALQVAARRRHAYRHAVAEVDGFKVTLDLGWGQPPVERPLIDLSTSGLAFLAHFAEDVVPLGMRLPRIDVRLPDGSVVRTRGRIRSILPRTGPDGVAALARCGVAFEELSLPSQVRLADALMHAGIPGVEDATGLSFDELWRFMMDTGFLYPEKVARLTPQLPQLKRTLTTLLETPNPLFKTLVFKNPELQGHLSAVRAYRHTWIVQHLATRKEGAGRLAAARLLNLGITDYSEQLPDMHWLRVYFRPNNRWPARVFGRFARRIADPEILRPADLRLPRLAHLPGAEAPSRAHPSRRRPRGRARRGAALRRDRADADPDGGGPLARGALPPRASSRYEGLGLERRREVLLAERSGRLVGFALLEISSPGLNFSELTNTFRLYTQESSAEVTGALAAAARARYGELGRTGCIALAEPQQIPTLEAMGFVMSKSYTCWTGHRSLYRRYYEYILRLYERTHVRR